MNDNLPTPPTPHNKTQLAYHSRRGPLSIDVTIERGEVHWVYKTLFNEWRTQLPLGSLLPYGVTTKTWQPSSNFIWVIVIFIGLSAALLGTLGPTVEVVAMIIVASIALLAAGIFLWKRGPIEWHTFDSYLPDKTIYFFRTGNDPEFDNFCKEVKKAILSTQHHNISPACSGNE